MYFLFRWIGYANGLSFKEIDDEKLDQIEVFVRSELLKRVQEKSERRGKTFEEKEIFFGMYADSIDEFKILRGERLQLLSIANILRPIFNDKGSDEFAKYFELPKGNKFDKIDMCQLSVGWFYGKKLRKLQQHVDCSAEDLSVDLLPKLKNFFKSFDLNSVRPINEEIFKVVNIGNSIRADVICVFCPIKKVTDNSLMKWHAIQMDKSGRWNFSNFRKHVKKHLQEPVGNSSKPEKSDLDSFDSAVHTHSTPAKEQGKAHQTASNDLSNFSINSLPIVFEDDNRSDSNVDNNSSETVSSLYKQFSTQSLRLFEAALTHNETKSQMQVIFGDRSASLNVFDILKDGNCLFGSLTHQLSLVKINSDEHVKQTADLRKNVVSHIIENIEQYKQVLKYRTDVTNIQDFVTKDLSKQGEWGGAETFLAVSNIFKVNILVFNEEGEFYLATGYKPSFSRTLLVAYRSNRKDEDGVRIYDHYDSLCDMTELLLYTCAKCIAEKIDKNDTVISL